MLCFPPLLLGNGEKFVRGFTLRPFLAFRRPQKIFCGFSLVLAMMGMTGTTPSLAAGDLKDFIFVANRSAPSIAAIDTRRDEVSFTIELPEIPNQFVLSEPLGLLAASHLKSQSISVVDLEDRSAAALVPVGGSPDQIQINPDGDLVASSSLAAGTVTLVSLAGQGEIRSIKDLVEPGPLVFDRDGTRLFVGSHASAKIDIIDPKTASKTGEVALLEGGATQAEGVGVTYLTRTPGGELGVAVHGNGNCVTIFDLKLAQPIRSLVLPAGIDRAYPTPDSQYVFIPHKEDRGVSMISTRTYEESERFPGASQVSGINTGMFGTMAVVLDQTNGSAVLLDLIKAEKTRYDPIACNTGDGHDCGCGPAFVCCAKRLQQSRCH